MNSRTIKINRNYNPANHKRDTQQLTNLDRAIAKTVFFAGLTFAILWTLSLGGHI